MLGLEELVYVGDDSTTHSGQFDAMGIEDLIQLMKSLITICLGVDEAILILIDDRSEPPPLTVFECAHVCMDNECNHDC